MDYFDGGSWADGYSDGYRSATRTSSRFSGLYYTPQMIVNGEYQTLGHNRANAYGAINRVLKNRLRSTSRSAGQGRGWSRGERLCAG